MSQTELAAFLNVKPNTVSRYESGAREPDIDILLKLADYFHVTTDYLLGKTDEAQPEQPLYSAEDLRFSQLDNSTSASTRQFINGLKVLLRELDDDAVSSRESQMAVIDLDPEIQRLYNQLDETARLQVKGYIHRLLDEKDDLKHKE